MKVAIIGAGITGLSCGYFLSQQGIKVSLFEKDNFVGGLASGFKSGDWYLEKFYHHIFKSDEDILNLTKNLGIEDVWFWKEGKTSVFYQDNIYPFSTALDLLKFSPLSLVSRLQTGLVSLFFKLHKDYKKLEGISSWDWLEKQMGSQSFKIIWQPLLEKKFGSHAKKVPLTWMWARIYKRSRFLGYPRQGFQPLINKLASEIEKKQGKINLNSDVKHLSQLKGFDKIVFTGSNPQFLNLAGKLDKQYLAGLKKINYLGSVVTLFLLKKPLTDRIYWHNVNDLKIPFVGIVEHANLANKKHYKNLYPVYLTAYAAKNSRLYLSPSKQIVSSWLPFLQKINKDFKPSWVEKYYVYKEPFTQPVIDKDNFKFIPKMKTPLPNVYLANTSQIYPWDRGVNYSVSLGKKAALLVGAD